MDNTIQLMWPRFLRIMEHVVDALENGVNFQELQSRIRDELNGLGQAIVRWVVEESDRELREDRSKRRGWVVDQRNHAKELLTVFGPVKYSRTYFKHTATGARAYLVDRMIGVTPHQRIDAGLKAELVERAAEESYQKSGAWCEEKSWRVSRQTVMKAVRRIDLRKRRRSPAVAGRRHVPYLFVQADEDHVPNQRGPRWQPKLVTVHEGVEGPPERRRLIRPRRFGGLYPGAEAEQLYEQVWKYLDATYDLEQVQAILVSGDGASWIRRLCEYLPGAQFVLDRFHAEKHVREATGAHREQGAELWKALNEGDRRRMRQVMAHTLERAETAVQKKRIVESRNYFERNWDGVRAWKRYEAVWPGCSAEGDVSHVYAERMSSRPRAWGREGVDQMSRLRVMRANGESVKEAYLSQSDEGMTPICVARTYIDRVRSQIEENRDLPAVLRGNLPAMASSNRALRRILTSLLDKNRLVTVG